MRTRLLIGAGLVAASVLFPAAAVAAQEQQQGEEISHEAEECIEILEHGGEVDECHEAPSPILPETSEIVWGAISFIVLFAVMAKFAYPPIKRMMEARAERIRENLDDAERTKADAQSVLDEYNRQLADARNEANRIIEEARQTADQLRRDLMSRAEQEAAELRQRTQEDIRAAQDRALADLRAQIADLTIELAEKVVAHSLDPETNRALIDSYINELERMN